MAFASSKAPARAAALLLATTILAAGYSAEAALNRRHVPTQPSIEIHLEALQALRQSVVQAAPKLELQKGLEAHKPIVQAPPPAAAPAPPAQATLTPQAPAAQAAPLAIEPVPTQQAAPIPPAPPPEAPSPAPVVAGEDKDDEGFMSFFDETFGEDKKEPEAPVATAEKPQAAPAWHSTPPVVPVMPPAAAPDSASAPAATGNGNIATYDGLEIAEGLMSDSNFGSPAAPRTAMAAALPQAIPPADISPPPAPAAPPVPLAEETRKPLSAPPEQLLAQASDTPPPSSPFDTPALPSVVPPEEKKPIVPLEKPFEPVAMLAPKEAPPAKAAKKEKTVKAEEKAAEKKAEAPAKDEPAKDTAAVPPSSPAEEKKDAEKVEKEEPAKEAPMAEAVAPQQEAAEQKPAEASVEKTDSTAVSTEAPPPPPPAAVVTEEPPPAADSAPALPPLPSLPMAEKPAETPPPPATETMADVPPPSPPPAEVAAETPPPQPPTAPMPMAATPTEAPPPPPAQVAAAMPPPPPPAPVPALTKKEDDSWFGGMKDKLTSLVSDEEPVKQAEPPMPPAALAGQMPDGELANQPPPVSAPVAEDQPTPPAPPPLPPLTKLVGDPEVQKEAEQMKVEAEDIAAPLPSLPGMSPAEPSATPPAAAEAPAAPGSEVVLTREEAAPPAGEPKEQQLASLPPPPEAMQPETAAAEAIEESLRLVFNPSDSALTPAQQQELAGLVQKLKVDEKLRVMIVAHASPGDGQESMARRLSLSRGLAVRAYLIDQGISNLRINVQSLGSKDAGDQPDRVDVVVKSSEGA